MHQGRGRERPLLVRLERLGRAEDGHHRVADVLHHGAALGKHRIVHRLPVLTQLRGQLGGRRGLGEPGVAADVGHQDGDGEQLGAREGIGITAEPLGQAAGHQAGQPPLRRLGLAELLRGPFHLPLAGPQLGLQPGVVKRGARRAQHRLDEVRLPGEFLIDADPGQRCPVHRARDVHHVPAAGIVRSRRAVTEQVTVVLRRPGGQRQLPVAENPAQRALDRIG